MKQKDFEKKHASSWIQFEKLLKETTKSPAKREDKELKSFPYLYRKICHHLDLATHRYYSSHLIEKLNWLATEGHQKLYRNFNYKVGKLSMLFIYSFPSALRKNWKIFLAAMILFYGPAIIAAITILNRPSFVYSIIDPTTANKLVDMYQEAPSGRDIFNSLYMFGFYIFNNTGIGLRTFGGGVILGIGSIFFVAFNGLSLGAIFTLLYQKGVLNNIITFAIGHGAFELTAIVISGMSGLKLGYAFFFPGRYSRSQSLKNIQGEISSLLYGFMAMFFVAAFIEAFWSSAGFISGDTKIQIGIGLWIIIHLYFIFSGRKRRAS